MEVFTNGNPSYKDLEKHEKQILLLPLVDTIKDFYRDPHNRMAFEKWKTIRNEKCK